MPGWFPSPEELASLAAYASQGIRTKSKKARCGGCGQFIGDDTAYVTVSAVRSHMKESCLIKVYDKIKAIDKRFEFASLGATHYGKVKEND